MNERHLGLFGSVVEANEIRQAEGVSADEAFAIQRERAAARVREYEAQQAEEAAKDNVVWGTDFQKGKS